MRGKALSGLASYRIVAALLLMPAAAVGQQQPTPAAARAASSGPLLSYDIVGIKLGMPAKDALAALKADNPHLGLTPISFKYEGFVNPLIPVIDGSNIPATTNDQIKRPTETVEILFTTPPNAEVVWGMGRHYMFPTAERPSMPTILDALRKKYGTESIPPGPPNASQILTWVYDTQGRPVGSNAQQLDRICGSTLVTYISDAKTAINSDIHGPRQWPTECTSIIWIRATLQGVQVAPGQFATSFVDVQMFDGGRYQASLMATRGVILNAVKAREQKQADEVNKRSAPKL